MQFNSDYDKRLKKAFDRFVDDEPVDTSFMRREILESWERSKKYNVKYDEPSLLVKKSDEATKQLIKENALLIEVARNHLKRIYDVIRPSGHFIFLADNEGWLLDIISDNKLQSRETDKSLVIGGGRHEKYVGTNAIGTCLVEGKAMDFYGQEHYNYGHKDYTCSGAPIHDPDGNVIGAISISALKEEYNIHTKAIVIAVVDCIEGELRDKMTSKKMPQTKYTFDNLIGECIQMKELKDIGKQVAKSNVPILLWGESGSGKEVLAQAIHNESNRVGNPFIAINCGAIPRELIESELFGYVEGAFTGAMKGGKIGKLEAANNGTLFLDEVESMPLDVQIKLLRVLSTYKITPLGSNEEIDISIRIISATKVDLDLEAQEGRFREDLYYRLNTITLKIPPLRERGKDIILIADHYIGALASKAGLKNYIVPVGFDEMLMNYNWKGNVRELRNVLEGVIAMSNSNEELNLSIVPEQIRNTKRMRNEDYRKEQIRILEMQRISDVLEATNGNISATAKALGMARSTLYQRIKSNKELHKLLNK